MEPRTVHKFESPESSIIHSADYDPIEKRLQVFIKRGGGLILYRYHNVLPEIWNDFEGAESKGDYFNRNIRSIYDGERVESVEAKKS